MLLQFRETRLSMRNLKPVESSRELGPLNSAAAQVSYDPCPERRIVNFQDLTNPSETSWSRSVRLDPFSRILRPVGAAVPGVGLGADDVPECLEQNSQCELPGSVIQPWFTTDPEWRQRDISLLGKHASYPASSIGRSEPTALRISSSMVKAGTIRIAPKAF